MLPRLVRLLRTLVCTNGTDGRLKLPDPVLVPESPEIRQLREKLATLMAQREESRSTLDQNLQDMQDATNAFIPKDEDTKP